MTSKSEGKAVITNLTGKKFKGRVISVVGALPLSNKGSLHGRRISRFSRCGRERRCLIMGRNKNDDGYRPASLQS